MIRKHLAALILILAGLMFVNIAPAKEISKAGFAMNTLINMRIFADDDKILDEAYSLLYELDYNLSMYNLSSDISRVNSNAGIQKVLVPHNVIEVVNDSKRLYNLTGGVFNPLIGAVTKLWKINQADNKIPAKESLDTALSLSEIDNLVMSDDYVFLKNKGCIIDLGGIAKGYASKKIADLLKSRGVASAIIDLGGNIYAVGAKPDGSNWRIGVRNPVDPAGAPALVLSINDCAVITSGGYERFKIVDGKRYTHFFDSKTGESIMSDLLSATIITPDGSLGDGLATAFMISGFEKSIEILRKLNPMPNVIFAREDDEGNLEIWANIELRDSIAGAKVPVKFFDLSSGK